MPFGRGAPNNPSNRFLPIEFERDPDFYGGSFEEELGANPVTQFWDDRSQSVVSRNDSPDIPMEFTANPYRGCEHGCSYCYARPTHEYLGYSAGLDFETQILVKKQAPELLRRTFLKKSWQPKMIALSGVTDPYQPVEARLQVTRRCLEVFLEFGNPVQLITKNFLITRDLDLCAALAKQRLVRVNLSITSLDDQLTARMEPRASSPKRRLEAIRRLTEAGIPVKVMVSPVIPGLNDHEMPNILLAAAQAGATSAGYIPLRLPGNVESVFLSWLEQHYPERSQKILNRVRELRGGHLNDGRFHTRFTGEGKAAEHLGQLFQLGLKRAGLREQAAPLRVDAFRRPAREEDGSGQLSLF
jgi:DNA repair photolyase